MQGIRILMNIVLFVTLLEILPACSSRSNGKLVTDPTESMLARAEERLERTTAPVSRVRTYIEIANISLSLVQRDIGIMDGEGMRHRLDSYARAITLARDAMVVSGRDPERQPDGYKDLEIAIRLQLRWLNDWKRELPLDERQPFDDAIQRAKEVRKEMLSLLFAAAVVNQP